MRLVVLISLLFISCQNLPEILPPNITLTEELCYNALECKVITKEEQEACSWCVECFFQLNGGEKKWKDQLSKYIRKCDDVKWAADYAGILQCVNGWHGGFACVKGN